MEDFEKTAKKLEEIINTKDLGESLLNDANRFVTILNDKNGSYEEKHFANVLAENLISITRDFPEIVSSTRKTR